MECATLTVASWILQEKSVFEIVCNKRLYRRQTFHKTYHELVTKYCSQLSQEVCVIKTIWSTSFQIMEKDLECAVISTVAGRN